MSEGRFAVIITLGATQTLAWASSFYLPAILAAPIARDLGLSTTAVFAAFSCALLLSALLGPRIGRTIDAVGGRAVLMISNILFAGGLGLMSLANSQPPLWLAWMLVGAGMGLGLYDAAFATLGRLYGANARGAITGVTLMGGFASTIGWPLSAWGCEALGWRGTCLAWAAAHLLIGLPLNRFFLPRTEAVRAHAAGRQTPRLRIDRNMWLLGFAFASGWMISSAMAAHLPRILEAGGATAAAAIGAGALIGPAQVAARIVEASFLKRFHPLLSARLSATLHPAGAALLALGGGGAAPFFTILHGAGNGVLTIARGTVPLAVYGADDYGYRLGLLGAPARMAQAAAPLLFGVLTERLGAGVLAVTAGLGISSLVAFCLVRARDAA